LNDLPTSFNKEPDMITVTHRFSDHQPNQETEILIIGSFNPAVTKENKEVDFFYGRNRNFLWKLLPTAFRELDLKDAPKQEKLEFMGKYKIDFIDLIAEIKVETGQEANYHDSYIDNKVTRWKDIIKVIDNLPNLKKVCFTRKTFNDIPKMKNQLVAIRKKCDNKKIYFQPMITPARYYNDQKQTEWTNFLTNGSR